MGRKAPNPPPPGGWDERPDPPPAPPDPPAAVVVVRHETADPEAKATPEPEATAPERPPSDLRARIDAAGGLLTRLLAQVQGGAAAAVPEAERLLCSDSAFAARDTAARLATALALPQRVFPQPPPET